jgi:hypothetical protein
MSSPLPDTVHLVEVYDGEARPSGVFVMSNCGKAVKPRRVVNYNLKARTRNIYKRETDVCTECLRKHATLFDGETLALETD